MIEENRVAEAMVEMTRILSSSLNTDKVLSSIVSRLREVIGCEECSIVQVDSEVRRRATLDESDKARRTRCIH